MPQENSNSKGKGKAVVKEEVSPLTSVEGKPFAVLSSVVKEEVAPAPPMMTPMNALGSDDKKDVVPGHLGGSAQDVGSSSSAAAVPHVHVVVQATEGAPLDEGAVPPPFVGVAAAPGMLPPPPGFQLQHIDNNRILLIKEVMQHCVKAMVKGDIVGANTTLVIMATLASRDGDPLQRVAFAFGEALGRRAALQMLPGLSRGLGLHLQNPQQQRAAVAYTGPIRVYFDALCPFLRVAASVANHAIVKAMEGEKQVHVVDLGGANPSQWFDLLRLLAARPEGAPSSLRLTVVSEHEQLHCATACLLHQEAVRLHVAFTFNPVRSHIDDISPQVIASFGVTAHPSWATAITSTLQLHRLIADEKTVELPASTHQPGNGRDGNGRRRKKTKHQITRADAVLRVFRDLRPKLLVLTEQNADHSGTNLENRVRNAFDYYAALFSDLEAGGAPRGSPVRAVVERQLLRQEIMDIVARDGSSRRERHESRARWVERMASWGRFEPAPVMSNFDVFAAEPGLLENQLSVRGTLRYWVVKDDAWFNIYSGNTPMFSVSTWQPDGPDDR